MTKVAMAGLGVFVLSVAGCAGQPSSSQVASSGKQKCEHVTGSLLCSEPDDQNIVGPALATESSPRVNAPIGLIAPGSK